MGEGKPQEALDQFKAALSVDPRSSDAFRGIGKAQEWLGKWSDAEKAYHAVVDQEPNDLESWFALGRIYSWNGEPEASYSAFQKALSLDADNLEVERSYAEVLSWNPARRRESVERYRNILQRHGDSLETQLGLAQALAWSGLTGEADGIYNHVLQVDPTSVSALVGLAEIARWQSRFFRSRELLLRARVLAPADHKVALGLAETEVGMGRYDLAMEFAKELGSSDQPDSARLQETIRNATRPFVQFGYSRREDRRSTADDRVNSDGLLTVVSYPVTRQTRLQILYQPVIYRSESLTRSAAEYALKWGTAENASFGYRAEVTAHTSPGAAANFGGSLSMASQLSDAVRLDFGVERKLVTESLQSSIGTEFNGIFTGQVYSNRASLGSSLRNSAVSLDLYSNISGGYYQGRNLDQNWQGQLDAGIGRSFRINQPYLRLGYGMTAFHFDQDQGSLPGTGIPVRRAGGYFSPNWFVNNFGTVGLNGKINGDVQWSLDGTLGIQQVYDHSSGRDRRMSSSFHAGLSLPTNKHHEVTVSYDFANVGSAFQRNLFGVAWKGYF